MTLKKEDFKEAMERLEKDGLIEWGMSHPINRIFNEESKIIESMRVYDIIMGKKKKLQNELQRINEMLMDD